jgi:Na+/proline symporter
MAIAAVVVTLVVWVLADGWGDAYKRLGVLSQESQESSDRWVVVALEGMIWAVVLVGTPVRLRWAAERAG